MAPFLPHTDATRSFKSASGHAVGMDEESYQREIADLSEKINANKHKLGKLQYDLDRLERQSEARRAGLLP